MKGPHRVLCAVLRPRWASLGAFVLESAQQRAVEAIERYERLRLNDSDRDRLLEVLEKPPVPNAAPRKAFQKYA